MNKKQIVTLVMVFVVTVMVFSAVIDNACQQNTQNSLSSLEQCFQTSTLSPEILCHCKFSNKQHYVRFLKILDLHKYEIININISKDNQYEVVFTAIEETKNMSEQNLNRIVSLRTEVTKITPISLNECQQDIQNSLSNLEPCFQTVTSSPGTLCHVSLSNKQHFLRFLEILDLHKYEIVDINISTDDRYVVTFQAIEETK